MAQASSLSAGTAAWVLSELMGGHVRARRRSGRDTGDGGDDPATDEPEGPQRGVVGALAGLQEASGGHRAPEPHFPAAGRPDTGIEELGHEQQKPLDENRRVAPDRKSTRLNSSH